MNLIEFLFYVFEHVLFFFFFFFFFFNDTATTEIYTLSLHDALPINTPDDLKGFKIRVPVSPLWTSMFKAFGASPASINFSEVYSALETKIVEGQENPLSLIEFNKFYEVQKYVSLTNHMWDGFWTLANGRAWASLPKDLQEIIVRNVNTAAVEERQDIRKLNDSLSRNLTEQA